jgi:hypothetical protein
LEFPFTAFAGGWRGDDVALANAITAGERHRADVVDRRPTPRAVDVALTD